MTNAKDDICTSLEDLSLVLDQTAVAAPYHMKALAKAIHLLAQLPRYHDHPANGEHADEPFILSRDPCWALRPTKPTAFAQAPFWDSSEWVVTTSYSHRDGTVTYCRITEFFATREAAESFASQQEATSARL